MSRTRTPLLGVLLGVLLAGPLSLPAEAQYFGQNKVQYDKFDFRILETEHFDIYYYPTEAEAAGHVARMAERWHARLTNVLGHMLTGRQAVILYASHPEFEQTNVIEGFIGESTGGVTEGARRRIVLPLAATLGETDHVLGHELVHAYQYDILGMNAGAVPLWFIEGMAEYLSLGPRSPQTAMWLRDAAIEDDLPRLRDLGSYRYFPYRFGHAFWAYLSGRWGDKVIGQILANVARANPVDLIEAVTELSEEEFSAQWHEAIRATYGVEPRGGDAPAPAEGEVVFGQRAGGGSMNVGPALSPDGRRIAFLSERSLLSIELYVADATTGRILRKLTSTATDPHFESLQSLASAGAWAPDNRRLAVGAVSRGRPVLAIFDTETGRVEREIPFNTPGEVFQPTWAPDGHRIVFTAQIGGVTDLYLHDLRTGETRQLTDDPYADLQASWAPDGERVVFVTDRFSSDLAELAFGHYELALIDVATGRLTRVGGTTTGNAVSPQWSPDGDALYFVSDANGRPDIYRRTLPSGAPERVLGEPTGIAGITPLSPALSVARSGRAAFNVFRGSGYEVQFADLAAGRTAPAPERDMAVLPPVSRTTNLVAQRLQQPESGLPEPRQFPERPYAASLSLLGVGQQVGVAASDQFGTYVNGGVTFLFSDMLGRHILTTGMSVDGGLRDLAGQAGYINRESRWNWGVFGERVPLLSGTVRGGFVDDDGSLVFLEQTDLFRQTNHQLGGLVAYPFSRASRVEFSSSARHIGFTREVIDRLYHPVTGNLLSEDRVDLPSQPSLVLGDVTAAFVRDTTAFGAVGPVLGQRLRFEVAPMFGDLRFTNVTADYRHYVMPVRPLTFAARLLHVGRYGGSGEDQRLTPVFLGYSTLVRGYDVNSFEASECTFRADGSCEEFDRLLGSRMIVINAEARLPAFGFTGELDYGPVPIELFGFFDAGVAWTRSERPSFAGGTRDWISSVGVGTRVNLLGFAIGEFNLAKPLNRAGRGWQFVFNLRPSF